MSDQDAPSSEEQRPLPPALAAAVACPRVAAGAFPKKPKTVAPKVEKPEKGKRPKVRPDADKPSSDGFTIQTRRLNTGTRAIATVKVRCRPGTFEWRYGRLGNAIYHAGTDFARAWERAGVASSGQMNLDGGGGTGAYRGQSDAQLMALDRVRSISAALGGPIMRRLVSYCVEGRTPKEIAASYQKQLKVTDRQVSDTLDLDLIELAKAMGYAA